MTGLSRLFHFVLGGLGGCRHRTTYRERRKLHGTLVMHLVCEDCGHAAPALERTAREHRRAVKIGAIKPLRARQMPAAVVDLARPRRRSA